MCRTELWVIIFYLSVFVIIYVFFFFFYILYIFLIFFPNFICDSCQWLHNIPGIQLRTASPLYMVIWNFLYLLVFFFGLIKNIYNCSTLIVDMMKRENLFASQGGPIILSQVSKLYSVFIVFVKVIFKKYIYKNICMKFLFIYFEIFILLWLSRVIITITINIIIGKLIIVVVEYLKDWKWVWEYYGPIWRGWKGMRELVC